MTPGGGSKNLPRFTELSHNDWPDNLDLTVQERDAPDLFKALSRRSETGIYRWQVTKGRIKEYRSGEKHLG